MVDENQKKVGAIWNRVSKAGEKYLFIDMEGKEFVAFVNKSKVEQKHPDLIMFESRPRETEPVQSLDKTWDNLTPKQKLELLDKRS